MNIKPLILTLLFAGLTSNVFSMAFLLHVDDIFSKNNRILNVEILSFTDSVMTCMELGSKEIITVKCHTKSIMAHSNSSSWEGTWPKIGEQLIMITHVITPERVLFARKIKNSHYRFWDPRSIPFANTVFEIPKTSDFQPTRICQSMEERKKSWFCSDGFLCTIHKLDKLVSILSK